jgi:pimeloyl-ACP methyl ester carboxylesterase
LLFDIAAVLSSSAALGGVAEAFVAHEINGQIVADIALVDLADQGPLAGGVGALAESLASTAALPAVQVTSPIELPASLVQPLVANVSAVSSAASVASTVEAEVLLSPMASMSKRSVANSPTERVASLQTDAGADASTQDASPGAQSGVEGAPPSAPSDNVLLDRLSTLPSDKLAGYLDANPKAIHELLADPPTARVATAWWEGLSSAQQKVAIARAPQLVGNLEGVPFGVRDTANRRYLTSAAGQLRASMKAGIGRGELVTARARLHMLEQVQDALVTKGRAAPRQLLTIDPSGYGRAAVVVGDLSTADYVSYLVPGMFFTVDGQMVDWTVIAKDVNDEQTGWVKTLSKTDPTMVGKKVATVAWIGYQTPGLTGITSLGLADEGADLLGNAIEGVQSARAGHEPYVTIVGHSYGSTAAMIELAKGGIDVDALVLIGSPGSAAQTAADLSVRDDNVYVGEASWDPVVNSAFYGSDPGSSAFGAKRMDVAGGTDPITHKKLAAAVGHLGYFDAGTAAMRNLALIGLDRGSLVTNGTTLDASRTLR